MISETTAQDSLFSIIQAENNQLSLNQERNFSKTNCNNLQQFHNKNSQHLNQSAFTNFESPLMNSYSLKNLTSASTDINSFTQQSSAFTPTKTFSNSLTSNNFHNSSSSLSSSTNLSSIETKTTNVLSNTKNIFNQNSDFHFLKSLSTDFYASLNSGIPLNKENYQLASNFGLKSNDSVSKTLSPVEAVTAEKTLSINNNNNLTDSIFTQNNNSNLLNNSLNNESNQQTILMSLNSATAAAVNALAQDLNARMHQAAANMSALQQQTTITNNMLASQCNNNYLNNNNLTTNIRTGTTNNNNNINNNNNNNSNNNNNNNLFNLMQAVAANNYLNKQQITLKQQQNFCIQELNNTSINNSEIIKTDAPKFTKTTSNVTPPLMSLSTAFNSAHVLNQKNNMQQQQLLPVNLSTLLQQLQSVNNNTVTSFPQFLSHQPQNSFFEQQNLQALSNEQNNLNLMGKQITETGAIKTKSSATNNTINNNVEQQQKQNNNLCKEILTTKNIQLQSIINQQSVNVSKTINNTNNFTSLSTTAIASTTATTALTVNNNLELCVVCGDKASGRHYGAISCEGCKGFFKRSIRKQIAYICRGAKDCPVTKFHRNRCQFCRLRKCLSMGMKSESVQAERRPMNATISTASAAVKTGMPSTSLSIQSAEIKNLISSPSLKTKYIKLNNGNRSLASFQQQMPCSTTSSNSTLTNNNTHPVFSSNDCATTTFQNYSLSNNADLNSTNNRFGELNDLNLFNEAQPNIFQQQGLLKIAKNNIDYNDIQIKCSQDKLINVESTIIDKLNSWRRQNELKKDNDLPSILDILNEANNSKFETILNQSSILPLTSNPPSMAALAIAAEMLKNRQNSLNITENFVPTNFFNQPILNNNNNRNHELQTGLTTSPSSSSASSTTSTLSNEELQLFLLSNVTKNSNSKKKSNNSHLFCIESTKFELPIPYPQPQELNMQFLCETVSRLLFLSVHWIKNVQCLAEKKSFVEHQMKTKWCDLFVLGLIQCAHQFDLVKMLHLINENFHNQCDKIKNEKSGKVYKQITFLLTFIEKAKQLKITSVEFAYLKTIAFTSNNLIENINQKTQFNNFSNKVEQSSETTRCFNNLPVTNDFIMSDLSPSSPSITDVCSLINQEATTMSIFFSEINTQACQELFEHILKNNTITSSKINKTTNNNSNRNYVNNSTLKNTKSFCPKLEPEEDEEEDKQSFKSLSPTINNKINNLFNENIKIRDWDEVCSSTSSFDENNHLDTSLAPPSVSPSLSTATTTTTVSLRNLIKEKNDLKDLETFSLAASPFHGTAASSQETDDSDHELNTASYTIQTIKTEPITNNRKNNIVDNNKLTINDQSLTNTTVSVKKIKKLQFPKADLTIEESVNPINMFATVQRHSNLLQLLPCLRMFNESVLVELFFSGLIGNMTIDTVIPFIYSMDVLQIFDKSILSTSITETNLSETSTTQEIAN